jgi:hypothetical protein
VDETIPELMLRLEMYVELEVPKNRAIYLSKQQEVTTQ